MTAVRSGYAVAEDELRTYLDVALEAAQLATDVSLSHFRNVNTLRKDGNDLASRIVTEADLATEDALIRLLSERVPEHAIIGEETGLHGSGDWMWALDPIDGTANYARGSELWGVMIGLAYKGRPVVGVIAYPLLGYTLHAADGLGAFRGDARVHVADTALGDALYYGPGVRNGEGLWVRRRLARAVGDIRVMGADCIGYGQICQGWADILICGSNVHDACAGVAIVREAGGKATQLDGTEWTTDSPDIVVTNGGLHEDVLGILEQDRYF